MSRPAPQLGARTAQGHLDYTPATFWQRYAAWSLDWLILLPLVLLLVLPALMQAFAATSEWLANLQEWMLDRILRGHSGSPVDMMQALMADPAQHQAALAQVERITSALTRALALTGLVAALYFIGFESSAWQATPGKRWLRLQVQAMDGQAPALARAAWRFLAGVVSWLTLNLGHAMVAFRHDGRALHDLIAGTRVAALAPMPAWARGYLRVQVFCLLGLLLALFARMAWTLGQIATM